MTLAPRVAALVAAACDAAGVHPAILQGSYTGGVGASAGTHAGGGAFDLDARTITQTQALALVDQLRRRNVAAWLRTPAFGYANTAASPPHVHGIVKDEPDLSPAARAQVRDYDAGLNGLANRGRDPHPRPPQTPFTPEDQDMNPDQARKLQEVWEVLFAGGTGTPKADTVYQRLARLEQVIYQGGPGTPHDLTVYQRLARLEAAVKEQP